MKKLFTLVGMVFVFVVSASAFAVSQQDKMKGCNNEAKESALAGDARKVFMSKCLKKDYVLKSERADAATGEGEAAAADNMPTATAAAPVKQKEKMKSCNADAKARDLKGDERKKFMSSCLKA